MPIKVSIVTSMYNKRKETLEIIEKLFFPSLINNARESMELILVDDCSPLAEETDKVVNKYKLLLNEKLGSFAYLKNKKNVGFSDSYNRGMKLAKGELILVVNDDVFFPRNSIKSLCAAALSNKEIGAIGPVTNYAGSFQNTHIFRRLESYLKKETNRIENFAIWLKNVMGKKTYEVDRLIGFCVVYKKKILKKVGYFDNKYSFGNFEDDDLNMKIRKLGYSIVLDAAVFVEHGGINVGGKRSFSAIFLF